MSDHRATGPLRRASLNGAARADVAATSMSTTLWMWLAAVAAVAALIGVVVGYSGGDQAVQSGKQEAAESAPASIPPALLPAPRQDDDARAPVPADDEP